MSIDHGPLARASPERLQYFTSENYKSRPNYYDTAKQFEGKNKSEVLPTRIHPRKLDLTALVDPLNLDDDTSKRFERRNQGQIKTTGVYPGKLDLTAPVYLTVTL